MPRTLRVFALAGLAASGLLSSCGDPKPADTPATSPATTVDSVAMLSDSARMGKAEGVEVGGTRMTPDQNLVANVGSSRDHTTLMQAIKAAGLAETLQGTGPFTVLAPSNAAFNKLPKGALDGLLRPEGKDKLKGVLTYHVIAGRLMAQDLRDGQKLTTMNGEKVKVSVQNGQILINNARISTPDVVSSNGITHVIDQVLLPSGE